MKDAFGKEIVKDDIVVYATRSGSSLDLSIGKVTKVEDKRIHIEAIAGTDYTWTNGKHAYNEATKTYEDVPRESYEVWLRTPNNIIVANGIDAMGIHETVVSTQRKNLAARKKK